MSKKSKPQNRKKKTSHGTVKLGGRARARVGRDVIGHDKNVQGDEISAGETVELVKVGAGASVGEINFGDKRAPRFKPEHLAAAKRAYLEFVVRTNQDVIPPSVVDAHSRVSLRLDEIYVPVTITVEKIQEKKDKQVQAQEEPPKRVELAQIAREHPRAVLLGEPGAGKTTILKYLALHFAKTLQEHPDDSVNVRDTEGNDYGIVLLNFA